jgi:hypothetical protein
VNCPDSSDDEFSIRLGVTREFARSVLAAFSAPASSASERVAAWADGAFVQVLCVSASGDPVDLGADEAAALSGALSAAIQHAGGA